MSRVRTLARSAALLAFASLTLAACSDDPSGPRIPEAGRFSMTVDTGADDTTFTGDAIFGGDGAFGVILESAGSGDAYAEVLFIREDESRPAVGEHVIADVTGEEEPGAAQFAGLGYFAFEEEGEACTANVVSSGTGTLRVTRSTAAEFAGTFTMPVTGFAECETSSGEIEGTLTGSFNAEPGAEPTRAGSRVRNLRLLSLDGR